LIISVKTVDSEAAAKTVTGRSVAAGTAEKLKQRQRISHRIITRKYLSG
jgi:hypothetical protein